MMEMKEAIKARHSVRQYKNIPIPEDLKKRLDDLISECNEESGLHIQLVTDDPECFDSFLAHYGENQGSKHKSKPLAKLCDVAEEDMPVWFKNGVKAAMMAPTAMNQQRFHISLEGEDAVITAGIGPMTKIDLGIVKYNFEAASGYTFCC